MKYRNLNLIYLKDRKSKWQACVDYNDASGARKHKRKSFNTTSKREAWRLAEDWFNEINKLAEEEEVKAEDTFEEMADRCFEIKKNRHLIEESTYFSYKDYTERQVYPYIGSLGFYSVERMDIEKWIGSLHNKGYSQNCIHTAYTIVKGVFNYYKQLEVIDKNPCDLVKVPSGKPRKSYMTDEQMTDFLAAVWGEYDNKRSLLIAFLLPYYCSLRLEEVCGLRWRDIDLEKKTLTVSSAVARRVEGMYLKDPKNPSSYRTIPLPEQMYQILKDRYIEIEPKVSWFVCGNEETFLASWTLARVWKEFRDAYELKDAYGKKLTFHALRHNFGYSGVRSGMDISALSMMMGHAKQSTTLNIYSDTSPDAVKAGMDKLSTFFKKRDLDE